MSSGIKDLEKKVGSIKEATNSLQTTLETQKRFCRTLQRNMTNINKFNNIMAKLFRVFKEAIEEMNEDKRNWVVKLSTMNEIANALSEYIKTLNETVQNNAKSGDEAEHPFANTLERIAFDLGTSTPKINGAINAAGGGVVPQGNNFQVGLNDLKKQVNAIIKDTKNFQKEVKKKEKRNRKKRSSGTKSPIRK